MAHTPSWRTAIAKTGGVLPMAAHTTWYEGEGVREGGRKGERERERERERESEREREREREEF